MIKIEDLIKILVNFYLMDIMYYLI